MDETISDDSYNILDFYGFDACDSYKKQSVTLDMEKRLDDYIYTLIVLSNEYIGFELQELIGEEGRYGTVSVVITTKGNPKVHSENSHFSFLNSTIL